MLWNCSNSTNGVLSVRGQIADSDWCHLTVEKLESDFAAIAKYSIIVASEGYRGARHNSRDMFCPRTSCYVSPGRHIKWQVCRVTLKQVLMNKLGGRYSCKAKHFWGNRERVNLKPQQNNIHYVEKFSGTSSNPFLIFPFISLSYAINLLKNTFNIIINSYYNTGLTALYKEMTFLF